MENATTSKIEASWGEGISTKQAIEQLVKALKEDEEYYYSWQANIAMAFKDEMDRYYKTGEIDRETVHKAANQAAKNFLNLLIK